MIFATKTHILRGRLPRVRGSRTSFKMGRNYPDSLQRETTIWLSLGLSDGNVRHSTVTYAAVSTEIIEPTLGN
jgi:hypothetical protein